MNDITFRKDEDGNTLLVETSTVETVSSLSREELKRQINQHADILDSLQSQLQAVEAFEVSGLDEDTQRLKVVAEPIVDKDKLENITN